MREAIVKLLNRGVSNSDDPILKRKKVVLNAFNLIGVIIAFPQIMILSSFDVIGAYAFLCWGIIVLIAYLLHGKLSFETVRTISLFAVLVIGSIATVRVGPELYIHVASIGVFFAAFIFYDLQKEWPYLVFFSIIEVSVVILTEFSVFQAVDIDIVNAQAHKVIILCGTLSFLILEIYIFKDIVTRSEREAINSLKKMNSEKDILLKEIHHRVKNNLQLLISLMNLKNRQNENASSQEVLDDVTNRVRSIAMLHDKVYIQESAESICIKTFVEDLLNDLHSSLAPELNISLNFKSDLEKLDVNHMVPLTLILNELVTNSFKHGLSETTDGSISIQIEKLNTPNEYLLVYQDSGVWKENKRDNNDIGLSLISSFSEQLDGRFELVDATDKTKKISEIYFKVSDN